MTVMSAPDEGTTLTLYFPLLPDVPAAESSAKAPRPARIAALAGASILVVDDDPAVRSIVTRILKHHGCSVMQASDGAAALALVDRHRLPDLVLTDLVMPGIDGRELGKRLRTRWPDLPVLFMSGYAENELRLAGKFEGEGQLIEKPFTTRPWYTASLRRWELRRAEAARARRRAPSSAP